MLNLIEEGFYHGLGLLNLKNERVYSSKELEPDNCYSWLQVVGL